ncbi:Endochitinase A [Cytospora mali]|uniref:Endochitinase A n=1 Tax=Cytospora mali TaxID=578113 RepID=A0A194UWH5_CYTMA|nr:Endochitinase A [Valsa mali var. pyri (nom. inval.)]
MHFRQSFVVAALAAVPTLASPSSVNVYWGQNGGGSLATACQDSSIEFITLGFVNISPENGGSSGYPGTNFGAHCWAEWYDVDGVATNLLSECPSLTPGIAVCQQLGKKVLISIGGVYDIIGDNYRVSSWENGVAFAEFMWGAFGPRDADWVEAGKPRPFDDGTTYNAVDGYDFDIESSLAGDDGYAGMITTLRELINTSGRSDIITASPQCPLDDTQYMKTLLQSVQFDRLWVQFYNNPQCNMANGDTLNSGFNYADWETFLADTPSNGSKIHIGLPGSGAAAGSGYVSASVASTVLCQYADYPMFGGVMIWDQYYAAENNDNPLPYNQVIYESLRCSCGECPVTTSTSSTISSTSTTSTSIATPTTTVTSASLTQTTSSSSSSASRSTVSTQATTSSSSISSSAASTQVTSTSSAGRETPTLIFSSSVSSSEAITQTTSSSSSISSSHHFFIVAFERRGSYADNLFVVYDVEQRCFYDRYFYAGHLFFNFDLKQRHSYTGFFVRDLGQRGSYAGDLVAHDFKLQLCYLHITSCAASVTDCLATPHLTTSSFQISTTIVPVTKAASTSSSLTTSHVPSYTTSTVYSTTIYTVTSCAPTVTDCPATPHLTTSSYPVSTLVVPVTEASPSPTTTTNPAGGFTTSTIYATTVYTVTSCAPTVTDCPATPHVTTSSYSVATTVVPVSETASEETVTATVVPISSAEAIAGSTSAEQLTTSTVYSTSVYTITSCAATVTDCPARVGSVTTEIIAISTTVCPVAEAVSASSSSPAETAGSASSGSSPSGSETSASSPSETESSSPVAVAPEKLQQESTFASASSSTASSTDSSTASFKASSSTLTIPVVTVSTTASAGYVPPPVDNNAGAASASGSGSVYRNGTASSAAKTQTSGLATITPTSSGVVGAGSTSAGVTGTSTPIVTAGAGRNMAGAGMMLGVVAVMAFML